MNYLYFMKSTEKRIVERIEKTGGQSLFFTEDFREYGTPEAVKIALHRLVKKNVLQRLTRGVYAKPVYSQSLNLEMLPDIEEVARAIANRDKAKVIPTGSYAMNALGLSTQVPIKPVYLTNATPRKIKIGNTEVVFKRTTVKNLSFKSELCMLVVQALREIGRGKVTDEEENVIIKKLEKVEYTKLKHDIAIAPQWMAEIMAKALPK
jgi:predicted transcriptional regulator of viral defense system